MSEASTSLHQATKKPIDTHDALRYSEIMILSFKCKEIELIWNCERSKRLPNDIQQIALRKLRMLNNAKPLNDLLIPPNNRLEVLKGNRKGMYSIRINQQWRLCFQWNAGNASNVIIEDYH